ncbi:hypothetical protein ACFWMR_21580 [Amycolatopsis thailandensis]
MDDTRDWTDDTRDWMEIARDRTDDTAKIGSRRVSSIWTHVSSG